MTEADGQRYHQFDDLIAQYGGLVKGLCLCYSDGDSYRCAEAMQECYTAIWLHLPSLRGGAPPPQKAAWVAWQCRGVFTSLRRRCRQVPTVSIDEEWMADIADGGDSDWQEQLAALAQGLAPRERRAFELMAEGLSVQEMAEELGIKPRSVVTLRHRVMEKLRKSGRPQTDSQTQHNGKTEREDSL